MDIFEACRSINDNLNANNEVSARNELIQLLDHLEKNEIQQTPLVNYLIKEIGLYPYIQPNTSNWQEQFAHEVFKVDIGRKVATLHREQSLLLKKLVEGESIAVSAPTSFGKSFVIDAFISLKQPKNIVIIVPTIALTDETRRRLYKKFSDKYKIITTSDVELGERNICIFPQERALSYIEKFGEIDILVIDEFYKASPKYDKERSSSLIRAIIKLSEKAKQKYFLAPNIKTLSENPLTKNMSFLEMLDFNTVFLEKHDLYVEIGKDETRKNDALLEIITSTKTKSLIYAGTYTNINSISTLFIDRLPETTKPLLIEFSKWLTKNYSANWLLTKLVKRGAGIHNGKLHRSISQIQIRLFEERDGFDSIISTSSIIEGVNTSAENVIVWKNKNGQSRLNDFTYKNIIGRSGRMFKHFIGKVYLLDAPPVDEQAQLEITFPDEILGDIDETVYKESLSGEQIKKIIDYKSEMAALLGKEAFEQLSKKNIFQISNSQLIKDIAYDMKNKNDDWNGLGYLNSDNPDNWDRFLYKIINLQGGNWDTRHSSFVSFIKILSSNWYRTIPELLFELQDVNIDIDLFFALERNVTFKFASLLNDVNELQKVILNNNVDVSPLVSKLSHAFLPSVVYQLEEYGLPRMISRKIHQNGIMNFENPDLTIHSAIQQFHGIGLNYLIETGLFDEFDIYILNYFYEGITLNPIEELN